MARTTAVLKAELPRKSVHLLAFLVPPVSLLLGRPFVMFGLASVTIVYAVSEYLRVHKHRRTLLSDAYSRLFRVHERAADRTVARPIYLSLSILTCLLVFREDIAYASIILVSLGDGLARVERLLLGFPVQGVARIGSGVLSFGLGFVVASLFVEPMVGFLAAAVAYLLESLPTRIDDNIAVPLGAALTAWSLQETGLALSVTSSILSLDVSAYWWLAEIRLPVLYDVYLFLEYAAPFAFASLIACYAFKSGWRAGAKLSTATAATIIIGLVSKNLAGRPRPCVYFAGEGVPACPLADYGFPSLHAALGATFLVYPVSLSRADMFAWRTATILLASSVTMIGPYTGIHWVSDTVGGLVLGIVLTLGTRRIHSERPSASPPPS